MSAGGGGGWYCGGGGGGGAGASDARVAVLGALEALLAVRPLGAAACDAELERLEKTLEGDVRAFLDALLLSCPALGPHVRRALAAHLRHNGGRAAAGLRLFLQNSLRGAHRAPDSQLALPAAAGVATPQPASDRHGVNDYNKARAYFSAIVDCADGSARDGYDEGGRR